MAFILIITE